jgi:two-component system invasion response regulator UvrY
MYAEGPYAQRVLRMGAAGYLTKESVPEQLVAAIRKVAQGGRYVSPALAEQLAFDASLPLEQPLHDLLSAREFEVLCMLVSGKTLTQIAADLCVSVKTISTHRTHILDKMRMKSNVELTRYAIRHRLVPLSPEELS